MHRRRGAAGSDRGLLRGLPRHGPPGRLRDGAGRPHGPRGHRHDHLPPWMGGQRGSPVLLRQGGGGGRYMSSGRPLPRRPPGWPGPPRARARRGVPYELPPGVHGYPSDSMRRRHCLGYGPVRVCHCTVGCSPHLHHLRRENRRRTGGCPRIGDRVRIHPLRRPSDYSRSRRQSGAPHLPGGGGGIGLVGDERRLGCAAEDSGSGEDRGGAWPHAPGCHRLAARVRDRPVPLGQFAGGWRAPRGVSGAGNRAGCRAWRYLEPDPRRGGAGSCGESGVR
mmetsp:Transcript_9204/g.23202  ORF Transcript_9204/g.23202 Transcript_9204/m.23202 type:complete len:278 (+) Transcript_9204:2529-3362(+)